MSEIVCPARVRLYEIARRAVEEGARCGWSRAHKYTPDPGEAHILDELETGVMLALCEVIDFDGDGGD